MNIVNKAPTATSPSKKRKKIEIIDHLLKSPTKIKQQNVLQQASGVGKLLMSSEPLIIADGNGKPAWHTSMVVVVYVPPKSATITTENADDDRDKAEGTEKSIQINFKIPENSMQKSNFRTLLNGDFIKLNENWTIINNTASSPATPWNVDLHLQADESDFTIVKTEKPRDVPETLGLAVMESIRNMPLPMYDPEVAKGTMLGTIAGFLIHLIPSRRGEEAKKDSPTSLHMTAISESGSERLQISSWKTYPTNPEMKSSLNHLIGHFFFVCGTEMGQHSEQYGGSVNVKRRTTMWLIPAYTTPNSVKDHIAEWETKTIFAQETICATLAEITTEYENMDAYSKFIVVQDVCITSVVECETGAYCGQQSCMAPMQTPTACERKHVQSASAPIQRTKVIAQVAPENDQDDISSWFFIEAVLAAKTLLGNDPANITSWENWLTDQSIRPLTLKLRLKKEFADGGFSLTVFNVIEPIQNYQTFYESSQ